MASNDSKWKFIAITLAIGFLLFQLYQMELFSVGKFHEDIINIEAENRDPCTNSNEPQMGISANNSNTDILNKLQSDTHPTGSPTQQVILVNQEQKIEPLKSIKETIVIRAPSKQDSNNKLDLSFLDAPYYKDR
eukprot:CAMPEP_0201588348 /NCGR_PEP_ID=MMETSP0190_2-20130828/154002_1 /ASSEMBLY_ACC=CAM_ASM_000263 /TAXON_ID=37353 /ORGANISM="Rosalina sp." /LENGTH=133 /DNA_ID=CAMNT_0048040319 /DNA_START=68 /DNA_END=466 /DNA_ORIENTATION=+